MKLRQKKMQPLKQTVLIFLGILPGLLFLPENLFAASGFLPGFSQPPFNQIRTSILKFDFKEAEKLIPARPLKGQAEAVRRFYIMQIAAWQYLLTEEPGQLSKFETAWESMNDYAESLPETDEVLFLKGEGTLWRAIVQIRKNDFISAAWNARSAYKYYEAAYELNPGNPDLLKGLGIFHFMVGNIPTRFSWLASITGLSGSMALGRTELQKAAYFGTITSDEALFFLAGIDLFVDRDPVKSMKKLDALLSDYPENGVFLLMKSIALQRNRQVEESVVLMESKYQSIKNSSPVFADQVLFRIGEGYYFMNQFDKAIPVLNSFLDGYKAKTIVTLARFRLALSYELSGQHEKAVIWFKQLEPRENNDFESYAAAEGKQWITRPMTLPEKNLWLGRNAFDSGDFNQALLYLQDARKNAGKDTDLAGEADYRIGRVYEESRQPELAIQQYKLSEKTSYKRNSWLVQFSLFQQARILNASGKKQAAIDLLRKAVKLDDHVFANSMAREIETELRKLGVDP